jgi:phosphoglycerate dehydrogenase-like enzyme
MLMVKLIVPDEIAREVAERAATARVEVELIVPDGDRPAPLEEADALVRWQYAGRTLEELLEATPRLRWLHSWSAGVESLPVDTLRERGIVLTNAAGVYAIPIAEWVLAAMLMAIKQAHAFHDAQREHRWIEQIELDELAGKTLLILGVGGIGREVAQRAAAFDMRVWGANRSGDPVEHVERVVSGDAWRPLLPEADFVVNTLPLTDETRAMIGKQELARFKRSAWLINVGRGATIDEEAMLQALRDGTLGGAAIDAWTEEPLPPDHPAWSTPHLIIWPHHSGSSPANTRRGVDLLVENVRRFAAGDELRNVVDLSAGY